MTREEVKQLLPIMQAFAEGKAIESRCIKGDKSLWYDDEEFCFDDDMEYRIKSEPAYRPFNNAEECWNEMQKHQPFGWLKANTTEDFWLLDIVRAVETDEGILTYYFENNTFADGEPFGVKEEEE